ncbi:S1C family serine protease [Protaetiibacter intestinalis]|uniref:PDZ domain-containing protein n=1 Tax=Protaetiibacter intestinalis TaxID=2419774 RepID=A0A387BAE1_9MICO|nr:trypsin-like peptidase domain-containing protein [Protaetiibacter intestinalis]AYF98678.1 PDZ domain-containing protein [Protaetiibacter intestinalis]
MSENESSANPQPETSEPRAVESETSAPPAPFVPPAPIVQPAPPVATPAPAAFSAVPPVPQAPAAASATPPAPRQRSVAVPVIAAAVVAALLGGGAGAGVAAWAITSQTSQQTASPASPQTITVNNPSSVDAVTAVAAKAAPSVVTISVTAGSSGGTGSGVILSEDGYVLTNTHVVTLDGESADGTIEVTTADGRIYSATVVGTDPIVDLAVIKLDDASGLTPIEWGDSDALDVGDQVIAIGAPLGLSNTVTDGIVSALDRSIQIASSAVPDSGDTDQTPDQQQNGGQGPFDFWNFDQNGGSSSSNSASSTISLPVIQTDAAINPGNSGGALLDDEGKLVGINVAIASTGSSSGSSQSGSIGVGFSIPASLAKRVSEEIIADGTASHGLLGASVSTATSEDSDVVGALIQEVTSGGAAASAGIKAGDVVTEFNGHPITSSTDLTAQVRALAAGSSAELVYQRDGKATTVTVKLGELDS